MNTCQREEYISNICTPMSDTECLQKASYDDYGKFAGALSQLFLVDHRVIGQLSNLDFLSRTCIKKPLNYIQWVQKGDNIDVILSYLFRKADLTWHEPYDHTELEKERIDDYIKTAASNILKYIKELTDVDTPVTSEHVAKEYLKWVSFRFWQDPNVFLKRYGYYMKYIAKAFSPYITGS